MRTSSDGVMIVRMATSLADSPSWPHACARPSRMMASTSSFSARSSSLSAEDRPISCVSRAAPPHPGAAPSLVCTNWIVALRDNTRKSVAIQSSAPPPTAAPSMAAIERSGKLRNRLRVSVISCDIRAPRSGVSIAWRTVPRSAPEQKWPPSPESSRTRPSSHVSTERTASPS
eukprot:scaffold21509_cov134-Isochrysis_galbana.AAC.2